MSNLTFYDRQRIEFYLHFKRVSLRDIAKFIGRDVSVVSREIKRHKPQFFPYSAELAQKAAGRKARITNKRKLDKCEELKVWVEARIREDWSPEQIAGRLKKHPPPELDKAKIKTICAETIYQYIYRQEYGERLYRHLRCHRPKRFKQGKRKERALNIPDRTPILLRDEVINQKQRFGDLEADMLCGKKGREAVSVHYERKSMHTSLQKLNSKKAEETTDAIKKTIENLPNGFVQSFTFDNGPENAKHIELKEYYDIETYFCEPYKAWQKGGVENTNKLLRQYIPKGTDMQNIDQEYLQLIEKRLNNRPRKSHDYLTPKEVLDKVLNAECCIKL